MVTLLFLRVSEFRALTAISSRQIFYSSLHELNIRKTKVVLRKKNLKTCRARVQSVGTDSNTETPAERAGRFPCHRCQRKWCHTNKIKSPLGPFIVYTRKVELDTSVSRLFLDNHQNKKRKNLTKCKESNLSRGNVFSQKWE